MADDFGFVVHTLDSSVRNRHIEIGEDVLLVPLEQQSEVLHRLIFDSMAHVNHWPRNFTAVALESDCQKSRNDSLSR